MNDPKKDAPAPEPGTMTFFEHLEELRTRLIRIALAFIVGGVVAWWFKEELLMWIARPYVEGWHSPDGRQAGFYFPAPATLFIAYIKLSLLGGGVLALPFILYQIWAFIAPGLYAQEKRIAIPFVIASTALFAGGAYFGWRLVFPVAFEYLLNFQELPEGAPFRVEANVMIDQYLEFIIQALVAFGVVFEIPVVIFFLSAIGLITHKHLIKFFRYFIVVAFVISAIITPPDPLSQILLATPLILLYALSIGIAFLMSKRRAKQVTESA